MVHHDGKREDVAGHDEDQEEQLASAQNLAPNRAREHFAGISHVVHLRVGLFKLADHVSGVSCQDTESDDEDDGAEHRSLERGHVPQFTGLHSRY